MNCEQAQRWILLADSGELPPRDTGELETHLLSCVECRNYRTTAARLLTDGRKSLQADGPGAAVLAHIKCAAAEQVEKGTQAAFWSPAVQILAYAAAIVLMASVWFLLPSMKPIQNAERADAVADLRTEQMGHIGTIMSVLSVESSYDQETDEEQDEATHNINVRDIARQLLYMEGLTAENDPDAEINVPDVELSPTDLQSNNTYGLPPKERV